MCYMVCLYMVGIEHVGWLHEVRLVSSPCVVLGIPVA